MPSNAISAQNTDLEIENSTATAVNITGVSRANPCVITAVGHGLANGAVVGIASVGGMTQLNGSAYVIERLTADTFSLLGVDSTSYTTYTSGGAATPKTWSTSNEHKSYSGFDGKASEIDVTTMKSVAKEKRQGLQDFGGLQVEVNVVETDAFQIAAKAAKASGSVKWMRLTKPNGYKKVFQALVTSFTEKGGVDGIVEGTIQLTITGDVKEVA